MCWCDSQPRKPRALQVPAIAFCFHVATNLPSKETWGPQSARMGEEKGWVKGNINEYLHKLPASHVGVEVKTYITPKYLYSHKWEESGVSMEDCEEASLPRGSHRPPVLQQLTPLKVGFSLLGCQVSNVRARSLFSWQTVPTLMDLDLLVFGPS